MPRKSRSRCSGKPGTRYNPTKKRCLRPCNSKTQRRSSKSPYGCYMVKKRKSK